MDDVDLDDEVCHCASTGRGHGYHQHPWFLEVVDGRYAHEFFVCAGCEKPTAPYLRMMMSR